MNRRKKEITGHIRNIQTQIKMNSFIDDINKVIEMHKIIHTDFYDPYELDLAKKILNEYTGIEYYISGGYEDAERQIIVLYPEYMKFERIPDNLAILKIISKDYRLTHSDYMGSILNQGVTREKIGDIIVHKDYGYVILLKDISDYIKFNTKKIGNNTVDIKKINREEMIIPELKYEEYRVYLTSLRLDAVVSAAHNLSRKDSSNLIKQKKSKVNWEPIDDPSYELSEGDMVSLRGYGRIKLYKIEGFSKKRKYIGIIRKLV